jgi:atlastin
MSQDFGAPIQLFRFNENGSFILDEEALENILLRKEVKDKKVMILSVAGAFRLGKSFLLSLFISYLNSLVNL